MKVGPEDWTSTYAANSCGGGICAYATQSTACQLYQKVKAAESRGRGKGERFLAVGRASRLAGGRQRTERDQEEEEQDISEA